MSIDAKDIYTSNSYIKADPIGYDIRNKTGEYNTKRFINSLDYSLDLIKLREIYESVYRRTNFSFFVGKKEYSPFVINITFQYNVKEYNKYFDKCEVAKSSITKDLNKNHEPEFYVKHGYNPKNVQLHNSICFANGEMIAIRTNVPVSNPVDHALLGEYFKYEDGVYKVRKTIPTLFTVAQLREQLYKNGFICDGIKYVRMKRTGGSSRAGKCLFIDEKLYGKLHKWEMCRLDIKHGDEVDLAGLEAYIALPLSSIIGTLEISPENILVVDDYESIFEDNVVSVASQDGELKATSGNVKIANSIFDGESLIEKTAMGKYQSYGFILLRNRMFKSACFNSNIQKWFRDHNITSIQQLNGFTLATKIEEIKLITTPSSIKFLKFGSIEEWFDTLDPMFGVVKHEKPTHFFGGKMVQLHYQLLNSLQLSIEETERLLQPSLEYLTMIKTDPTALRYHIKYNQGSALSNNSVTSKNDIVYKMLGINDKFAETKLYYDFRKDLMKSFVTNLKQGHILVNGNYSTLLGNPIELLQQAIGQFRGESQLGIGNIYSKRFEWNKTLLASRSPHICSGNVLLTRNKKNEEIDKYFNLTNEIACINSIGENILQRLNGADFDSDSFMLTDDITLIHAAQKNYHVFKVPTCFVSSQKVKRRYTPEDQADLDIKTSVNKIGEIVNLSAELNAYLLELLNLKQNSKEIEELYLDICILAVMSGIEIDKAKKEYIINTQKELNKIKQKHIRRDSSNKKIKPLFFSTIAKLKGYHDKARNNYKFHNSTMDYIHKIVTRFRLPSTKRHFFPFSSVLKDINFRSSKVRYDQVNRIISLVRDTNTKLNAIWQNSNTLLDDETKYLLYYETRQECVEYIDKIVLDTHTMYWLLKSIELEKNKDVSRLIFGTLFGAPNKAFFELIQKSQSSVGILVEDKNGDIPIYDMRFFKCESEPKYNKFYQ